MPGGWTARRSVTPFPQHANAFIPHATSMLRFPGCYQCYNSLLPGFCDLAGYCSSSVLPVAFWKTAILLYLPLHLSYRVYFLHMWGGMSVTETADVWFITQFSPRTMGYYFVTMETTAFQWLNWLSFFFYLFSMCKFPTCLCRQSAVVCLIV